jgi:hypothetical protein
MGAGIGGTGSTIGGSGIGAGIGGSGSGIGGSGIGAGIGATTGGWSTGGPPGSSIGCAIGGSPGLAIGGSPFGEQPIPRATASTPMAGRTSAGPGGGGVGRTRLREPTTYCRGDDRSLSTTITGS